MNAAPGPSLTWKQQQRALTARAKQVHIHSRDSPQGRRTPGTILRFPSGTTYEVQIDGSLRRVHLPVSSASRPG